MPVSIGRMDGWALYVLQKLEEGTSAYSSRECVIIFIVFRVTFHGLGHFSLISVMKSADFRLVLFMWVFVFLSIEISFEGECHPFGEFMFSQSCITLLFIKILFEIVF